MNKHYHCTVCGVSSSQKGNCKMCKQNIKKAEKLYREFESNAINSLTDSELKDYGEEETLSSDIHRGSANPCIYYLYKDTGIMNQINKAKVSSEVKRLILQMVSDNRITMG